MIYQLIHTFPYILSYQLLDPSPFLQWGVLGVLAFVIATLTGVIYKLFITQNKVQSERDAFLMNFSTTLSDKTSNALKEIGTTIANSHEKLADSIRVSNAELKQTIDKHTRVIDRSMLANSIFEQVKRMKLEDNKELTTTEIESIVRSVVSERSLRE